MNTHREKPFMPCKRCPKNPGRGSFLQPLIYRRREREDQPQGRGWSSLAKGKPSFARPSRLSRQEKECQGQASSRGQGRAARALTLLLLPLCRGCLGGGSGSWPGGALRAAARPGTYGAGTSPCGWSMDASRARAQASWTA